MKIANMAAFLAAVLLAAAPVGAAPAGSLTVLDNDSYLRVHMVFRTPVMVSREGEVKPIPERNPKQPGALAEFQSPLPPGAWREPDFDDSSWDRERAPIEAGPEDDAHCYAGPSSSLICGRAKFLVDDPAQARDLTFSIRYVGGVVVYLNGKELARGHMPAGAIAPETLAEKYPDDLYRDREGKYIQIVRGKLTDPEGFERRYRALADVTVPANLLRKGVNVLAIEVHRAAINEAVIPLKRVRGDTSMGRVPGHWAYAGLQDFALRSETGTAVQPNVRRPAGVQVWNCMPWETLTAFDYGDIGTLQPVAISSPRNGVFSGRLAVGAAEPIRGLTVTVSDLTASGGGRLASSAVQVRCAAPGIAGRGGRIAYRYNALGATIPATIPVVQARAPAGHYPRNFLRIKYVPGPCFPVERKNLVAGAVASLWLTVRVPRDSAPGDYEGTVTLAAEGLPATSVPLRVTVSPWLLPEPREFRIVNFGQHSPDSIASYYDVPLWSERHYELMGRSLALMAELNSRVALAELAIDFYGASGNRDTMVRWIRQPDGSYRHDFTILDRYLDLAERTMGKPALLRLNCWGELRPGWGGSSADPGEYWKKVREGRMVSLLDPATGKVAPLEQPVPGTPASRDFWKPVLDEVRKRVEARGWWDVTAMGHNSYNGYAHPTVVSVLHGIWPDGVWSYTAHNGVMGARWAAVEKGVTMPVRFSDCVWTRGTPAARGYRELLKPRPSYWCYTFRTDFSDSSPLLILRDIPEEEIMSGHDGLSDFGVDFFVFKSPAGRDTHVGCGRGTGGPTSSTLALLAPGPDGPLATERYEMLREGVELGEAVLFLERALQEKRIGGELAERVNRCLDERDEAFLKRWPSGRFARDRLLLALAGEVARAAP